VEEDIKFNQYAFSKKRFVDWLDPILDYGIPKDAKAISFNIYDVNCKNFLYKVVKHLNDKFYL